MKKILRLVILLLIAALCIGAYALFGPRIMRAYTMRAAEQATDEDPGRAAELYARVLESSPRDEELRIQICDLYMEAGNYTRAEHTIIAGLRDVGPSVTLYKKLCALYVVQDKLLDAVDLLAGIRSPDIKDKIDSQRPAPPVFSLPGATYDSRVEVELTADTGCVVYVSWEDNIPTVSEAYTDAVRLEPGVTRARAVAVNSEGLVSDWAVCEYNLVNIVDPISFEDPAVEYLIRQALGKPSEQLYTTDLWSIEELASANEEEYRTLSDLAYCTGLRTLRLTGVRNRCDITALAELTNLTELTLASFGIDAMDLETVGQISGLEKLNLPDNNIGSVAALESLAHLSELDLSQNSILNIDPLSKLGSLKALNLSQNAVQDLAALSSLSELTVLIAEENRIVFLPGLETLTALRRLELSYNPGLSSLEELSGLTALETVQAAHCRIEALPDLSQLKSLTTLNVTANYIENLDGIAGLSALKILNCAENMISSLEPLRDCSSLETIDASKNSISSVEPLGSLPALKTLRVENNSLTTLLSLKECPSLTEVYAFGNALADPINAFNGTKIKVYRQ